LRHIHTYLAQSSTEYALRVIDRLTRRSQQIGQFPESGRIVPEAALPQIREVLEGPYRIMYHIKPDQIDIIAVIHGAQQTPWTP
jgi:plasmid stabilization system protein ParE